MSRIAAGPRIRTRSACIPVLLGLLLGQLQGCQPAASEPRNNPRGASSVESAQAQATHDTTAETSAAPPSSAQPSVAQPSVAQPSVAQPSVAQNSAAENSDAQRSTTQKSASPAGPAQPLGKLAADDVDGTPWLKTLDWPYEYWETQYFNASRIGVTHYRFERTDSARLTLTAKTSLHIQRAGQPIRQNVSVQSIERVDGAVDSYFEEMESNGAVTKAEGSITDEILQLRTTAGGNVSVVPLPWPKGTWGPMGVHQLLLRRPMRSGERRQTHVFLPQIHKVALVTLAAGTEEDTTSPEGMLRNLVPVDVLMQLEDQGISSRMWVDAQGRVQKTVMTTGPNISSYRVSREVAQRMESQSMVDVFAATSIKIDPPLKDPQQAQRINYVVESKSKDPYSLLSRQANQSVRSESAFRAALTVFRPQPQGDLPKGPGQTGPMQTPPAAECSASSMMIKSDDAEIAKLASVLAGAETDSAALALKLTEGVFKSIRKKNFSRGFDTAQDVARSLEGDCTEHAVLLTALLRNRGIPARIASGVIATETPQGSVFAYHMWSEAWLEDRWLPLDGTLGTVAGCGHIKFLESALSESNPYAALLPVLTSLGELTISVGEVIR